MGERALQLAEQFQRINDEIRAYAEGCSPAEWVSVCPAEGWTVAAVIRHIAAAYTPELELIQQFVSGKPIPAVYADWSTIDESNARFAEEFAEADRDDTLALLTCNGTDVRVFLSGLSDAQLDYTAYFPLMKETRTTQRMIERILLDHPLEHLESIRAHFRQDG